MSNEKSREISPDTALAFAEYETWDLSPVVVPQRSNLYALQPIGVGTPLVESLSSYVIRLAEAHSVFSGMLVQKMIVPLVPGYSPLEQHGLFREAGDRSALINGAGLPALYAVQALETLTLQPHLQFLTFLPLAKTLSMRNLIRLEKTWCPICYEEWRFNGKPIYDPLLWSVREISSCHIHGHPLSIQCPYPNCARTMSAIGWRARIGYCSYCWRWLGIPSGQVPKSHYPLEVQDMAWQQWVIQAFSEYLAAIPTVLAIPERQRISQVLMYLVQRVSEGNIAAFARMLGMSTSKVHAWCQGKRTPEIDILLQLCFQMNLSLYDFFFQELERLHFSAKSSPPLIDPVPRKKRVPQVMKIYQALEEVLIYNEQPPPTLEMIRQRLGGYHITILKRIHPAACQEIVTRRKCYVQQHKEERLQRIYEEIKQIAHQLHTQGKVLTRNRIALHLSLPGVLNDPRVRIFLKTICRELETSNGEKSL